MADETQNYQPEQSPTIQPDKKQMSRREFLGLASATAVALSTRQINSALRNLGVLEEGNAFQMAGTLTENVVALLNENNPNHEVFITWLKFNGARYYAQMRDMPTAAALANHFLYGEGKDMDISDLYLKALRNTSKSRTSIFHKTVEADNSLSDEDLILKHVQSVMETEPASAGQYGSLDVNEDKPGPYVRLISNDNYLNRDQLSEAVGQEVEVFGVSAGGRLSSDISRSLGNYTLKCKGIGESVDGRNLTLQDHITVQLKDRYDWDASNGLSADDTIAGFIIDSGLNDKLQLPREVLLKLDQIKMRITDEEVATMVDAGLAHEFEVMASYEINKPITLDLTHAVTPDGEGA